MKKLGMFLVVGLAALALSIGASASSARTVTVVMHDPGCHWFSVNGQYKTRLTVAGPVSLYNIDEAALRVAGGHGVKIVGVTKRIPLASGTYHITMVGQTPDDNHLLLVVK